MEKKLDPQHLDVVAFARDGLRLQGEGALADWPRLAEEQHGDTVAPGSCSGCCKVARWLNRGHLINCGWI